VIRRNAAPQISSFTTGTITEDATALTNLVGNPGFEANSSFSASNVWKTSGVTVGFQIWTNGNGQFTPEAVVPIYGAGNTPGMISQDIATVTGQHYTLSYWGGEPHLGWRRRQIFRFRQQLLCGELGWRGSCGVCVDQRAVLRQRLPRVIQQSANDLYAFTQYSSTL